MPQMAKDVSMARFIAFAGVAVKPQLRAKAPLCCNQSTVERFY
jgi:hypothetical protein